LTITPNSPNGGAAKWANREICHFLNGSATLTTNISRTKCCCAAIIGRLIDSNKLYKSKSKHMCLLANFRHQGATKVTQMPIFRKFQKIVEKNHSSDPQISFCQSIVLINVYLLQKIKKFIVPFSRNSVLQRHYLPPLFSKSMGSHVRLKTYLVQLAVLYMLVNFECRCFSGSREIAGVPKIFDPLYLGPLGAGPPVWEFSNADVA
jgi:hypothetical protein